MLLIFMIFLPALVLFVVCATMLSGVASSDSGSLDLLLSGESVADRYRPMERLLQDSELNFLSRRPGFTAKRIRQARSQRRRIFRQYLRSLCADFSSLALLVKALIVESSIDRPDLFRSLVKTRVVFSYAVLCIQLRLLAHAAGVSGDSIDITDLTSSLDRLTEQALALRFATAGSPA
jgi:hypothetical protein